MEEVITFLVGPEAEWYDMGYIAGEDGLERSYCPYALGSVAEAYWTRGYEDFLDEGK